MNPSSRTVVFLLVLLGSLVVVAAAETKEADRLFMDGNWKAAAGAYRAVLEAEPDNAQAWLRLGVSLRRLEKYGEAAEALLKAEGAGLSNANLHASLALTYLAMGKTDEAFSRLERAAGAGLPVSALETGDLFSGFRDDSRFGKILEVARRKAHPCMHHERYKEFDFWVGEWDVYVGANQVGTNVIQKILGECVVFENWTSANGISGKSFNYYDPGAGKWRQNWVSENGGIVRYEGEVRDGVMRYEGESVNAEGARELAKVVLKPLESGNVHHSIEHSRDEGKSWYTWFDAIYVPKGSGPPPPEEEGL